ncbi:ABC transporter permease [Trujillonella endophytica]|uniref:Putative ABC transport system permease protein n=1 Tax=Trujillonella endophytica TaxID=673521 RepID=A0A1H8UX18_9ACTN|nr:FtsX-like permease family protein [Trujillella endophytica]SEP07527.1 putative ABC transport system permease protein [Trujillella endophytica]
MLRIITANLRAHLARLVASTVAIVIAVGFVVATLTLGETTRATMLEAVGARYVSADVVVTSDGEPVDEAAADLDGLPGVAAVDVAVATSVQALVPGRTGAQYLLVDSVADDPALRWQQLAAGALPDRLGEAAVSERVGAEVGDVLTVTTYGEDGREDASQVTVVGVVDLRGDPSAGINGRAFVIGAQVAAWGALGPTELRIAGTAGTDADDLAAAVGSALAGRDVAVRTGEEQAVAETEALTGDADVLTLVLLVFGTVALLVAGLVIANTFAVLLAQRTRELALLRCVGATARQIRRGVLAEAALTGVAASALGVGAGIGLAAGVSALVGTDSPVPLAGVSVPLSAVLGGLAIGTLTTLVAALAPARAATRVAPLAAMRPLDPAPLRSRGGMLRLVAGLLLVVPGVLLMAAGVAGGSVPAALAGGALSFLGLVLLAQRAVPPVVAAAGRLARRGGVTARLAGGNATRNPRRTAATATALLIGVTLTSAMVVGAASTRSSAQAGLAAQYPTDVEVTGNTEDGLPASLVGRLQAVDGVRAAVALTAGPVTGPDGYETRGLGVDPARAAAVLRSTDDLPLPADGTVVLPWWTVEGWGVAAGEEVTLTGAGGTRTFTALLGDTEEPLLTATDLAALAPGAVADTVWLRLDDGADPAAVVDEVTDLAGAARPTAAVTGLASERAALDEVLDVLLLVVTGLLGVAVVIALIGVGNTLALSVVERRQENGLLRALGLTRGQVRGLLAWEAALVAGVAAVLGVLLGTGYGLVGVASLLGGQGEVVLSMPWLQVAAIVVVATVAGLLASVLPARRAARTPPVAALAA